MRCPGIVILLCCVAAAQGQEADLARQLRELDDKAITVSTETKPLKNLLAQEAVAGIRAANQRETAAWQKITTREEWEKYRDQRIRALEKSLGLPMMRKNPVEVHVGQSIDGEGYKIECLVYRSWTGQWVTANLYLPAKKPASMPGIIICHSHHNPKTEGELQDMGVMWAKLGCAVLVPDQLGHGERREHPFVNAKSFDGQFRPSRQDYYFRYNLSLQLYAAGSSLVGWMVADMSRGVDLLRDRGADMKKIILLGAVAGGGDPAAVTAAIDKRISCIVPFNFGGPQPETIFPLPENAEDRFNYAGGGSWESTRNLAWSAKEGFLPWVIVGSVAPRHIIHAHEFAWDKDRDPVWKRYQKIMSLYKVDDHLAVTHGSGSVRGSGPGNTHCNNIGAVHRKDIYPALKKWFDISIPEKEERSRRASDALRCLTDELKTKLKPESSHSIVGREAGATAKLEAAHCLQAAQDEAGRRELLQQKWSKLLGRIDVKDTKWGKSGPGEMVGDVRLEKFNLRTETDLPISTLLLTPPLKEGSKSPVVVGFCQDGKAVMLRKRSDMIAELLKNGVAVCLIDVRGTGETFTDGGRGRTSSATSISATELMLGRPLVGSRLRDLRIALSYLRQRPEIDAKRMLLWGDSFAPVNHKETKVERPLDVAQPAQAEPLGGLLALFGTLYEDVKGAYGRGGLVNYRSLLDSPFIHVPHDAIVPGGIPAGDLDLIAKVLAKRVRLDGLVDGVNRAVGKDVDDKPVQWMLKMLRGQ